MWAIGSSFPSFFIALFKLWLIFGPNESFVSCTRHEVGFQENTHREEINHGGLKTLILLFFCDRFKMLGWTGTSMWLFLFFMGYTVLLMSSCFALIAEGCRFSGLFNINKVCKPYTFLWVSLVKYWALYRGLQLHCKIYWTQVLVLMC